MSHRIPINVIVALGLLAVPTIVAAAEPALATSLVPGQEIDVSGTGFPADADVLLVIQRNGADDGSQTLHADAAGSFTATIAAGPGRGGAYTLIATSGSAKAVAEIVAVETAGGLATGGVQPTQPATDAAPVEMTGSDPSTAWAVLAAAALVSLLLAIGYRREREIAMG
jgi:hypothetical protein